MSNNRERWEQQAEAALIARAQQGDSQALDSLLKDHQDRVYRTALAYLAGNEEAAFEVAQEVLISTFRNIGKFRGDSQLATWLYRMTINHAKNWQVANGRRAARLVSIDTPPRDDEEAQSLAERLPAPGRNARDAAADAEAQTLLLQRLQQLPEEFRTVLALRYIEDASYEEIAATLEISIGTVKSRLNRGRAELRKRMGNLLAKGGERV